MNGEIIHKKDLPSHIKMSQHLLDKCLFIVEVDLFGRPYYIPVTKEVERVIKMREPFKNGLTLADDTAMLQDIINAIYLQMRDTIGVEIHQKLSNQIEDGFSKLFELPLEKEINKRLDEQLPPHDDEQKKRLDKLETKISVFEDYTIEKIVEQKKRISALERFTIDRLVEQGVKQKEKPKVDENIERGAIA